MVTTFTEAVETFLANADWLSESEAPAVTALQLMAKHLDDTMTAAMITQYNQTYRYLRALKPADTEPEDELEKLLDSGF